MIVLERENANKGRLPHWCRYEYQARGSTHAHGCAKLRNDPGVCTLVEKAAVGWLATKRRQDDTNVDDDIELLIQQGEVAKTTALQYADWLVTTMNDSIPDDMWRLPVPHPCTLNVTHLGDTDDADYHDIVNAVQRHTRCSPAYCLRKKPGQQEQKCRFNYPRPQQHTSTLQFENLPDGTVRASLTTKRNDPRLNTHNRLMVQHWRANVDVDACARYMAKYASKGEPRSQAVSSIFKSSVDCLSDNGDAHKALRSAMVRSVGERDFSAQETAHQLLSLPLVSCTFSFVALSLDGGCALRKDERSGEHIIDLSVLSVAKSRSQTLNAHPGWALGTRLPVARREAQTLRMRIPSLASCKSTSILYMSVSHKYCLWHACMLATLTQRYGWRNVDHQCEGELSP